MITSVLAYLETASKNFPDKPALIDESRTFTYGEYLYAARTIGTFLLSRVTCGQMKRPIAVLIDRNALTVLAFMGCLYSGNFYVPLDTSMPEERTALILDSIAPLCVLDAREAGPSWEGAFRVADILQTVTPDPSLLAPIRTRVIDTDPLYAIFTSGSTGVPKGVLISHRSAANITEAFRATFGFDDTLVFGNQSPFDYDAATKSIYGALHAMGTLVIIPKRLFMTPKPLIEYLSAHRVDTLIWAVSALRIVENFKTFGDTAAPALRYVMFSGEVMPARTLNYWMDHVPQARFVNLYGPTETTCNCTYYEIRRRFQDDEPIPIGGPLPNYRVFLRDEAGKMISGRDTVGELCVEGAGLALGYWNDRERTDRAFVQDPAVSGYRDIFYATGDLAYYDRDGELIFASRRDDQIKHMGHRIELGEIETALNAVPFIQCACCLYNEKAERIVCFYQAEEEDIKGIVACLRKKLPKYMWPNEYRRYDWLPRNKNGKIDRAALRKALIS